MAGKDVVRYMDMRQLAVLDDCSLCIEQAMTNTPIPLKNYVQVRRRAAIHTPVVLLNVLSTIRAGYFVTLIDEASAHVEAFGMKSKGEAAALLERQVC